MATERLKKEQVVEALQAAEGYVAKAASILGVTVQTVYNYRDRYADVAEAFSETRERRHDHVESKLMKAIDNDNIAAIIFYLKTQGKARGWVERQELTGRDGGPVESATAQVHFYIPDNGRG